MISGRRAAQLTRDGQGVTHPGPGPQHRRASAEIAEHGHRDHPLRGADQVPADDAGAQPAGLLPHPVGEFERLRGRGVTGCAERDDECGRRGTHGLDVGGVLRDGLSADVVRRRPVQPEVPALDEHVGGHHCPAVRRDDDRGVVAGTDGDHRRLFAAGDEPVDDGELPQPGQAVGRLVVRHDTSCRRLFVALNTGRTCGTFGPCGVESMQRDGGDSGWSRLSC